MKMGAEDDPEAFLDLFERTAEIWHWPRAQWAARLILLLSGEAQLASQQLPAASLLAYDILKKAILQRVGRSPEQHRHLFRSMELERTGHPFAFSQCLHDSCRKWLLAGDRDVEGVVDQVVLEQLICRLPEGMSLPPALLELDEVVKLAITSHRKCKQFYHTKIMLTHILFTSFSYTFETVSILTVTDWPLHFHFMHLTGTQCRSFRSGWQDGSGRRCRRPCVYYLFSRLHSKYAFEQKLQFTHTASMITVNINSILLFKQLFSVQLQFVCVCVRTSQTLSPGLLYCFMAVGKPAIGAFSATYWYGVWSIDVMVKINK
ncbi:uncharacterized protein LOC127422325 [Myxocyprinus asiaticus]|uniref:uncharacterized protein LOC127422325 n=1 Tax=Myxocyprinus asiaticus TaxID=70543 RepID=UPI00222343B6|nr:uncharacterized protein LOC127422325 [Myxocyprinus asiaticus]XP_051521733.1 uncharacterized protein LOC127422325 [Myxocyprinus asiaticus]